MKYICIDSSTKHFALALNAKEKSFVRGKDAFSSYTMLSTLEQMLDEQGLRASELDYIGVVVGVGSFTGVRVGLATAKGLAWGEDKIIALNAFELLAFEAGKKDAVVLIRSNLDNIFVGVVQNAVTNLSLCKSIKEAELYDYIKDFAGAIVCQEQVFCDLAKQCGKDFVVVDQIEQAYFALIEQKIAGEEITPTAQIDCIYLKKPQVEER